MIRTDQTEQVVWLTLDRPPVNVLNIVMLEELDGVLDEVAEKKGTSVLVLGAAAGSRAFCAGVDIADHTPDKLEKMIAIFHSVLRKLLAMPQTTVAAVDGAALGGGLELALMCDITVASSRAKLGLPEIQLACFPPAAIAILSLFCGRAAASDLILTGEPVEAEAAQQLGLVSRVFPAEGFDEQLREMVAGLAKRSPAALRLTTRLLRERILADLGPAMDAAEKAYLGELASLPDMTEGLTAFIEKREPQWAS